MLIGTYEHNLDGKNRVFVPAKFREELGDNFIYKIFPSKHPSIQLFNRDEYERTLLASLEGITDLTRKRRAHAKGYLGAGEASYDNQGRIILNPAITSKAKIEKQCIFVGFGNYVEVMSPETYENYLNSIYESNIADEEAIEREEEIYRGYTAEGRFISLPDED